MQSDTTTRKTAKADAPFLLRKADIARNCSVSLRTIDQWIAERKIPFIKVGRNVRFRWPAVEAALIRFERKEATRPRSLAA